MNSTLTRELMFQIRALVLEGKNERQIKETLGISDSTWHRYKRHDNSRLQLLIDVWRNDRLLELSNTNFEEILSLPNQTVKQTKEGDSFIDYNPQLIKLKFDASKFIKESLEESFKKRQEIDLTSKGQVITGFNYIPPNVHPEGTEQSPTSSDNTDNPPDSEATPGVLHFRG